MLSQPERHPIPEITFCVGARLGMIMMMLDGDDGDDGDDDLLAAQKAAGLLCCAARPAAFFGTQASQNRLSNWTPAGPPHPMLAFFVGAGVFFLKAWLVGFW